MSQAPRGPRKSDTSIPCSAPSSAISEISSSVSIITPVPWETRRTGTPGSRPPRARLERRAGPRPRGSRSGSAGRPRSACSLTALASRAAGLAATDGYGSGTAGSGGTSLGTGRAGHWWDLDCRQRRSRDGRARSCVGSCTSGSCGWFTGSSTGSSTSSSTGGSRAGGDVFGAGSACSRVAGTRRARCGSDAWKEHSANRRAAPRRRRGRAPCRQLPCASSPEASHAPSFCVLPIRKRLSVDRAGAGGDFESARLLSTTTPPALPDSRRRRWRSRPPWSKPHRGSP